MFKKHTREIRMFMVPTYNTLGSPKHIIISFVNKNIHVIFNRVNTKEQSSGIEKFSLFYVPGDTNVDITLERLEVEEGSKRTISKRYLYVHSVGIKHFLFNVTKSPHHGQVKTLLVCFNVFFFCLK